jgi:hypothetical protein
MGEKEPSTAEGLALAGDFQCSVCRFFVWRGEKTTHNNVKYLAAVHPELVEAMS